MPDIIKEYAEKINNFSVNVFNDKEVDWCEITLLEIEHIKQMLNLIDTELLEEAGQAIIMTFDCVYDSDNPYYKPIIHSKYYSKDNQLPEIGDWNYEGIIGGYIEQLRTKRQKMQAYQKLIDDRIKKEKSQQGVIMSNFLKETPIASNINWNDNLLLRGNELRVTPMVDELKEEHLMAYLLFSEKKQKFYTPSINSSAKYVDGYEYITKCSDKLIGIFCDMMQARMINDYTFTIAQVVAEWNYFAFVISMVRTFPEIIKRMGKPSKDECRIVEKNVNFYDGDYLPNQLMKSDNIEENLIISKLENQIKSREDELEMLRKENEQLKASQESMAAEAKGESVNISLVARKCVALCKEFKVNYKKNTQEEINALLACLSGKSASSFNKYWADATDAQSKAETWAKEMKDKMLPKKK